MCINSNASFAGRYRIGPLLGEGGGGRTFHARDELRGADVAIKIVGGDDRSTRDALVREFASLRALRHPHLVEVLDFGVGRFEDGDVTYLAMRAVLGATLEVYARGRRFADALAPLADAVAALGALHVAGTRHGDFKPSNVIVDGRARGVLIDLGASGALDRRRIAEVSGTMGFLAPEVLGGGDVDERADLFAVGRTLEALFEIAEGAVPKDVRALARRLVAHERAARPTSAAEVLELLDAVVPPVPGRSLREVRSVQPERLVGRERELAVIEELVTGLRAAEPGPRVLWIWGAGGTGRSRLLIEAKWRLSTAAEVVEALATERDPAGRLVDRLAADRAEGRGLGFVEALRGIEQGPHRALVLDDLDRVEPAARGRVLAILRVLGAASPVAAVVASSAPPPDDLDRSAVTAIEVGPLDVRAIARFLDGRLGLATAEDVLALTGGHAGRVSELVRRVLGGELSEKEVRARDRSIAASLAESTPLLRPADDELGRLAERLKARPPIGERDELRLAAAAHLLRQGRPARAKAIAWRVSLRARGATRASALDIAARAALRSGAFGEAVDLTRAGLAIEGPIDGAVRARLEGTLGTALAYGGGETPPRPHLEEAIALSTSLNLAEDEVRARIQLAIVDYRGGETTTAASGLERALARAEAIDALDLAANAAQNLGTVRHQLGDLGLALDAYERGLLVARALGARAMIVSLACNLAKLYADLGQFDRARALAASAGADASRASMRSYEAFAFSVEGDAELGAGRAGEAAQAFARARGIYAADGAARELVEVDVDLARTEAALGRADAARARLDAAVRAAESTGAADVVARALLASASVDGDAGGASTIAKLERSAAEAARAGQRLLEADARTALASAFDVRGAKLLADRELTLARAIWERTLATLPGSFVDRFRAHRMSNAPLERSAPSQRGPTGREEKLARLVAIARRLSASLDPAGVLELAVDAAIEFTGAERGFIVVAEGGAASFSLLAPRNMGQRSLEGEEVAFSRGIAERVVRTGEPIVTVDAQRDERFHAQRSIHAMRLASVLSVPVRGPDGVLGALYLDHRFMRGAFAAIELDLVLALADHVAIALTNARLHAALTERTRDLDAERARTLALYREKADEAERLAEEVRAREQELTARFGESRIIGRSAPMRSVFDKIARVAKAQVSVLVTGESGTGKELVARAIHTESARGSGPFVAINCGAIPEALLESELFGHKAGAFTGASRDRVGLVSSASGGTLFLDEIGEMPTALQVKLLRVLQEREVTALGSSEAVQVDVRVLAATHRDLRAEVARGRFREDLFYRLAVVEIALPPLRERLDDLGWLAPALVERAAASLGKKPPRLSKDAMAALYRHEWPGNVRELENVLTKAIVLADRDVVRGPDLELGAPIHRPATRVSRSSHAASERRRIEAALAANGFNVADACRNLGIPRATMYRKLKRYGIDPSA